MGKWRVGEHYGIHVYENEQPIATFHKSSDATIAVRCVNMLYQNPYLPPAPEDGKHVYWDAPTDIGGNYRCKLCGAYKGSSESEQSCLGEFKESGKMRVWVRDKWERELEEFVNRER